MTSLTKTLMTEGRAWVRIDDQLTAGTQYALTALGGQPLEVLETTGTAPDSDSRGWPLVPGNVHRASLPYVCEPSATQRVYLRCPSDDKRHSVVATPVRR